MIKTAIDRLGNNTVLVIVGALPIIGAMFIYFQSLASKSYVDTIAAATLKEAFEHSDMNRQSMMLEFRGYEVKIDLVLQMVTHLQRNQMKLPDEK